MAKEITRLVYRDFRPLRKGEPGYSPTRRLLISPTTGEVITRRQFQNKAQKVQVEKPPTKQARKSSQPVQKPRKSRKDKGMTRGDYRLIKPLLDDLQRSKKRKPLTKNKGKARYESAKRNHIDKLNKERERRGDSPLPYDYEPEEAYFYDTYDIIRHPDNYSINEINDALDYFWGDDIDQGYDYDYPLGETP